MGLNVTLVNSEEVEDEKNKEYDHLKLKSASHKAKMILRNKKNKGRQEN